MSEFSKFSGESENKHTHKKSTAKKASPNRPARKNDTGSVKHVSYSSSAGVSKKKKTAQSAASSISKKKNSTAASKHPATNTTKRTATGNNNDVKVKTASVNSASANQVNSKKKKTKFSVIKKALSVTISTLLSIFMIGIITFTICCTALTVWILEFKDDTEDVTIESLALQADTFVYAKEPSTGEFKTVHQVNNTSPFIPVKIEELPQYVCDAFVYLEDERFYSHDGVDYKRTFSVIVNELLHFYGERQGASTITQQLVKNLTKDDAESYDRKIREIFRAMQLEKKYTKADILEGYMNYVEYGGGTKGIELAAQKYFGKSAKDLSIAEAASLAAIPNNPENINPFVDLEANQERQRYAILKMYENGSISYDDYIAALNEKLILRGSEEYMQLHPEENTETETEEPTVMPWYVDAAMFEVADWFMDKYGIEQDEAFSRINTGGYKIYTTVDLNMQSVVEQKFLNADNFPSGTSSLGESPQSSFIAMDYTGNVLAIVGGIGEKPSDLCLNRPIGSYRDPGSTIKPISSYGKALQDNYITWSSMFTDKPLKKIDGEDWPKNYSNSYSYATMPVIDALKPSLNTIPAQLVDLIGVDGVYDFATQNMGLELDEADRDYAPLTVGGLTNGVTLENLVNAYIPYGNGGTYYKAHIVSKVENSDGSVLYSNEGNGRKAVDADTAYIMNKLLQEVVNHGTGTAAQLSNKKVAGKTGTSQDWRDLSFIGLTEDFVSGVWIGYDTPEQLPSGIKSASLWQSLIGEYANNLNTGAQYPICNDVIEQNYCKDTGLIAGAGCPVGGTGYYKASYAPLCTQNSSASPTAATETTADAALPPENNLPEISQDNLAPAA